VFGKIKYKFAKGNISARIINRINEKNATSSFAMMSGQQDSEIDCLIMMDRSVDLVSPFCVQQTYEGQIDENFGIQTT